MKHFQRVLLAAGLLVSLSGCDAISDPSSDIPEQIVVADSTTEPSDAETAEAVIESEPSLAGTESASESTSTQTTLLSETVSTTETTTTVANADALVGDTGLTTSEWLEKAQGLYETAAKTMFQYCCTSQMFQYDFSDSNQPNYYHITDYDTIADATEPYYEVFSRKSHSGDFDSLLLEADGKLYGLAGDRGSDITYHGATVTALESATEDTLTFTVALTYTGTDGEDTTTKNDSFSLHLEDGVWKVDTFTLPY